MHALILKKFKKALLNGLAFLSRFICLRFQKKKKKQQIPTPYYVEAKRSTVCLPSLISLTIALNTLFLKGWIR